MVTVGGLGSGIAIPLAQWGGWRVSLVSWALPAVLALLIWAPQLRAHSAPVATGRGQSLWNSTLAWQVSLFMACQSTAFYVMGPEKTADYCATRPEISAVLVCPGSRDGTVRLHDCGLVAGQWEQLADE